MKHLPIIITALICLGLSAMDYYYNLQDAKTIKAEQDKARFYQQAEIALNEK